MPPERFFFRRFSFILDRDSLIGTAVERSNRRINLISRNFGCFTTRQIICKARVPVSRILRVALRSPHLPLILSIVPFVRNYEFQSRRILFPRAALP